MKASEAVKECFATRERTNVLATSDPSGKVNVAVFGSMGMPDDETLMVMLGDNRSWENIQENPEAACLITLHGATGMGMKGCRLYVKVRTMADDGPEFDAAFGDIRARIGEAAGMLKHLVLFDVTEARPILDFGQGI